MIVPYKILIFVRDIVKSESFHILLIQMNEAYNTSHFIVFLYLKPNYFFEEQIDVFGNKVL